MSEVKDIWLAFNKKNNNFTCKLCSKQFIIDPNTTGEYTFEQRAFLTLAQHLKQEH